MATIWGHPIIRATVPSFPEWSRELIDIHAISIAFFATTWAWWGSMNMSCIPHPSLALHCIIYFRGVVEYGYLLGGLSFSLYGHMCSSFLCPYLIVGMLWLWWLYEDKFDCDSPCELRMMCGCWDCPIHVWWIWACLMGSEEHRQLHNCI